jgi:pyridoxamine 5'-phosphate oxidase
MLTPLRGTIATIMQAAAFEQFRQWFDDAIRAGIAQPNAMALATTGINGKPAVRMVLLSSFDNRGFVFHTNYASHKGQQVACTPGAALLFWWEPLGRQVRIEGSVEKTSVSETDAYFATRPRGSQLGAWVSEQSQPIPDRAHLELRLRVLEQRYQDQPVPCPPQWGGYRVIPDKFEFWTSRENRLHDRMVYEQIASGKWEIRLLAP